VRFSGAVRAPVPFAGSQDGLLTSKTMNGAAGCLKRAQVLGSPWVGHLSIGCAGFLRP
jgi:hypothetical protein